MEYLISIMAAGIWAIALILLLIIWQLVWLERKYSLLLAEIIALKEKR